MKISFPNLTEIENLTDDEFDALSDDELMEVLKEAFKEVPDDQLADLVAISLLEAKVREQANKSETMTELMDMIRDILGVSPEALLALKTFDHFLATTGLDVGAYD